MPQLQDGILATLLARLNYRVERIGAHSIVASPKSSSPDHELTVHPVDDTTWVLQEGPGPSREVAQIGPASLRTHLLVDLDAARAEIPKFQKLTSEYLAQEQVSWALRRFRINCVLDVGANVGQYATRLRQHGYRGRIVSFEPLPDLAAQLRAKASSDPDWLVFECALGDEDGTTEINAVPGTMSSMLPSSDFGREWSSKLSEVHTTTISIARLDSLYDQVTAGIANPRVYLKMDTQGYDLQAFRGAGDRIREIRALQSEVACIPIYDGMPRLPEMLSVYEEAGFEISGMYPVTFHRRTLRVIEFDLIMVRADAAASAGTSGDADPEGA